MKRFLALLLSAMLILSTLVINVSAAGPIDFNFDNLDDGVYTQADITSMFGASFASGSAFTASAEDGMLSLNTAGVGVDSTTFSLDEVFTEGTLEFKARFKTDNEAASGGYNLIVLSVVDESGDAVEILRINSGGSSFARPQGNSDNHGWVGPALTADADGFYNVSITVTDAVPAEYTGQTFYVEVNDMNAGGAKKSSHTVKVLDGIASLTMATSKNGASAANNSTITFDTLSFKKFKPEVISISAPAGNISPKVGIINIGFNTAINPGTITDGITFTKVSDGSEAAGLSIEPAADNKSVTLTFDALDIEDYVLSVNASLKAAGEDGEAFVPYTVTYTPVIEPFAVTGVSNEGGSVLPNIGTIEVSFNNPVNEETLAEGVTFTKEDGTAIPGGAVVRMGDTSDKVEVLVGRVAQGNYVLTIGDMLEDGYGDTLDEPVTYGYIVEDSNPAMVEADFTNLESRVYTHNEIASMAGFSFGASSQYVLTGGVEGGLEIVKPSGVSNDSFNVNNLDVFETGELTYNLVFKNLDKGGTGSGSHLARIFLVDSDGKSAMVTGGFMANGLARPTGLNGNYVGHDGTGKITATPDQDGFLDLDIVITDDIPSGHLPGDHATNPAKFVFYIYDNNNNGALIYRQSIYESLLSDVVGLSFNNYSDGANTPYERGYIIKKLVGKLNEDKIPNHVMSTDTDYTSPASEDLEFIFTNAFKNITADGISFMSDGNVVETFVEVNADEKTIKLAPVDYLGYGQTYTVAFPAPLQVYEFTTEDYADRLTATTNGLILEVHLVNNEADEYLIVASYKDAEGNFIGSKSAVTSGTNASINILGDADSVVVNAYKIVDGCYVKASLPVERSL